MLVKMLLDAFVDWFNGEPWYWQAATVVVVCWLFVRWVSDVNELESLRRSERSRKE
jgi:hypothetical protein